MSTENHFSLRHVIIMSSLAATGIAVKMYQGPGMAWINGQAGGLPYTAFWCVLGNLLWPKTRPIRMAALVTGITCLLECMQLWHPPALETVRATLVGRTLLGTTFAWSDFPWYFIGGTAGWRLIRNRKPAAER